MFRQVLFSVFLMLDCATSAIAQTGTQIETLLRGLAIDEGLLIVKTPVPLAKIYIDQKLVAQTDASRNAQMNVKAGERIVEVKFLTKDSSRIRTYKATVFIQRGRSFDLVVNDDQFHAELTGTGKMKLLVAVRNSSISHYVNLIDNYFVYDFLGHVKSELKFSIFEHCRNHKNGGDIFSPAGRVMPFFKFASASWNSLPRVKLPRHQLFDAIEEQHRAIIDDQIRAISSKPNSFGIRFPSRIDIPRDIYLPIDEFAAISIALRKLKNRKIFDYGWPLIWSSNKHNVCPVLKKNLEALAIFYNW